MSIHFRLQRMDILEKGYPGYDTSIGWIQYSDDTIKENLIKSMHEGFGSVKLKVGSDDPERDIRRAFLVRDTVGDDVRIMLDVNQQWTLPQAIKMCAQLRGMNPYWIEEPTHPDDVLAHQTLAHAIAPLKLALGEHVPNQIIFKNYLQAEAAGFLQPDCVRLGGVSEFITVSLMARKYGIPVVPHVGDMGQIHQHLVLFNHNRAASRSDLPGNRSALAATFPASSAGGGRRLCHATGAGQQFGSQSGLSER